MQDRNFDFDDPPVLQEIRNSTGANEARALIKHYFPDAYGSPLRHTIEPGMRSCRTRTQNKSPPDEITEYGGSPEYHQYETVVDEWESVEDAIEDINNLCEEDRRDEIQQYIEDFAVEEAVTSIDIIEFQEKRRWTWARAIEYYLDLVDGIDTKKEQIKTLKSDFPRIDRGIIARATGASPEYIRSFRMRDDGEIRHHRTNKSTFSESVRNDVVNRDGESCVNCGSGYDVVHHIIPASEGGEGEESNLACLCDECHLKAHGGQFDRGVPYEDREAFWTWTENEIQNF